jgi:ferredoxin
MAGCFSVEDLPGIGNGPTPANSGLLVPTTGGESIMGADEARPLANNVEGKYFTTEECDGCAYCASVAPENFEFDRSNNTYYVSKQPENAEEEAFMQEATEDCPVDAIRTRARSSLEPTSGSSSPEGSNA